MIKKIDINKDYKIYSIVVSNEEFIISTSLGKDHAIRLAREEWEKENHPIIISCEEIK